jgi:hypothetical protein
LIRISIKHIPPLATKLTGAYLSDPPLYLLNYQKNFSAKTSQAHTCENLGIICTEYGYICGGVLFSHRGMGVSCTAELATYRQVLLRVVTIFQCLATALTTSRRRLVARYYICTLTSHYVSPVTSYVGVFLLKEPSVIDGAFISGNILTLPKCLLAF